MGYVSNDNKLAVHVAELSRLDADLKQNVAQIHGSCSAFASRDLSVSALFMALWQDLEKPSSTPALSE